MTLPEADVRTYESVRRWLASRRALWGESGDEEAQLEALTRFCGELGKDPDKIVDDCLKRSPEGGTFLLRTRARREYMQLIDRFEESGAGRDAGNAVRSFFIHNGVAMNPSILK
jgi:hypothetical protein